MNGADNNLCRSFEMPAVASESRPVDPRVTSVPVDPEASSARAEPAERREIGGPAGPEPTRFGDWERKGRCIDF